jgi:ankyrin repeat protein
MEVGSLRGSRARRTLPLMVGATTLGMMAYYSNWWSSTIAKELTTIAQRLIEQSADVNAPNHWGKTPAHYAAETGNVRLLRLLTTCSEWNINARDVNGDTALHFGTPRAWLGSVTTHLYLPSALTHLLLSGTTPCATTPSLLIHL